MSEIDIFADKQPRIRLLTRPADANMWGTVHGGVLLTNIDEACGIAAMERARSRVVTLMVKEARFHVPTQIGDLLSVYAEVVKVGTTSLTVSAKIEAERLNADTHDISRLIVMTAELVYVAVDGNGQKVPVPPAQ